MTLTHHQTDTKWIYTHLKIKISCIQEGIFSHKSNNDMAGYACIFICIYIFRILWKAWTQTWLTFFQYVCDICNCLGHKTPQHKLNKLCLWCGNSWCGTSSWFQYKSFNTFWTINVNPCSVSKCRSFFIFVWKDMPQNMHSLFV